MEDWIFSIIESYGYAGVFFIIVLENVFPPIPSEIVLPFSGFVTTKTSLTITGMIFASTLGSVVGAVILYWIGTLMDVERLEQLIDRWGNLIRVKKSEVRKADSWFDKYGIWTVFFCRMVPFLRSVISIPAGMSNMKLVLFLLFTTLGTLIWNSFLITIGAKLGESWSQILTYTDSYSSFIYAFLGISLIILLFFYIRKRNKYKPN